MEKNEEFKKICESHFPHSKSVKNTIKAAAVGGGICFLGQWLKYLYSSLGLDDDLSFLLVTLSLILLASLFTAFGFFDRIATFAGAGTLVPVTGFSNSVTSSAIDNRREGFISGVGSKIFTVAGPVILYSSLCGVLYGLVYFIYKLFS